MHVNLINRTAYIVKAGSEVIATFSSVYPKCVFSENDIEIRQVLRCDYKELLSELEFFRDEGMDWDINYHIPIYATHIEDGRIINSHTYISITALEAEAIIQALYKIEDKAA